MKSIFILYVMGTTAAVIVSIVIFILTTLIYWKITQPYVIKTYGEKMWHSWTSKTFYWTSVLFVSGGITVLIVMLLKNLGAF